MTTKVSPHQSDPVISDKGLPLSLHPCWPRRQFHTTDRCVCIPGPFVYTSLPGGSQNLRVTEHPRPPWSQRWKHMMDALPWKSTQSSQCSSEPPGTASVRWQPLSREDNSTIHGPAEKQGTGSQTSAESFRQTHPGSLCVLLGWAAQPRWAQHALTEDQTSLPCFSRLHVNSH